MTGKKKNEMEQMSIFDVFPQDTWFGRTSPEHCPQTTEEISKPYSQRLSESANLTQTMFLYMVGGGREAWTPSGAIFGISNGVPFSIAYRVHDAQFWGVPQRRKRIALVADFNGLSASEILFERKSVSGDPKQECEKGQEVATTFGRSPYEAISFQERAGCEGGGKGILIQNDRTGALSTVNNQYVLSDTVCIEGNGSRPSHHGDGYIESDKMYTLNATEQHKVAYVVGGGQSRCSVNENIITNLQERSDQEDVACAYAQDRYDTFSPSDISPTIKAQGGSYGGGK